MRVKCLSHPSFEGSRSRGQNLRNTLTDAVFSGTAIFQPARALRSSVLLPIAAAALAVEIPFFFLGTPSGHDVEFHLYSWLEVLAQWKQGIIFPRWAALANFGYGEPRFIFYPPVSWVLGSLISSVVPWTLAASVYIWLALTLAGISTFLLARRWMEPSDAVFAAVLYVANPYHLVIVYWRSAFAELLASCLIPILLLIVLRIAEGERRVLVPLSLVLAAAWLTNAPAAVMIHYSLALLAIYFAWKKKSARVLLVAGGAVVLGACLAAFYLLPAIYEQKWVNIAEAVSAGSRPQDNFLFIHTGDVDHDAFNRIVSWVAVWEMAVVLGAGVAGKIRRTINGGGNALWCWAIACSILLFPFTAVFWRVLPKLQFMQFPWRWLLCLSLIFVIFVTAGVRRWWMRAAVAMLSVLVVAGAWNRIQAPWWDHAADLREMQDNMADGTGYEGVEEYAPVGVDLSAIEKDAAQIRAEGEAVATVRDLQWGAESKTFTVEMSAPERLVLRLFNYPAWRVEVNGRVVEAATREDSGQMLVPVEAGLNRVQIRFTRTWDRIVGGWISAVTALGLAAFYCWRVGRGSAVLALSG